MSFQVIGFGSPSPPSTSSPLPPSPSSHPHTSTSTSTTSSSSSSSSSQTEDEHRDTLLRNIESRDLMDYGMIPEFVGRFPVLVSLSSLDRDTLVDILTKPKDAIVKQYTQLFQMDQVHYCTRSYAQLVMRKLHNQMYMCNACMLHVIALYNELPPPSPLRWSCPSQRRLSTQWLSRPRRRRPEPEV